MLPYRPFCFLGSVAWLLCPSRSRVREGKNQIMLIKIDNPVQVYLSLFSTGGYTIKYLSIYIVIKNEC